jgi:PBP4 family serine-type D-alanyl-D-alanine carboxypeptidase
VSRGDVYLRGQHDPTLSEKRLRELAQSVAGAGVKRIEGDLLIGDSPTRDTLGSSALRVTVRGAAKPGKPAIVDIAPQVDFVRLVNRVKTFRGKRSRLSVKTQVVADEQPRLVVTVSGKAARGRVSHLTTSARMPSTFTASTLRAALSAVGVEVTGRVRVADFDQFAAKSSAAGDLPVELGHTESPAVEKIDAAINKPSNNFLADRLIKVVGAAASGGEPAMAKGVRAMNAFLENAGVDSKTLFLDSGSGLSHATKLSAKQIVQVLRVAAGYEARPQLQPHAAAFLRSLAIGGVDGTLRRRFRHMPNGAHLVGKTGTLNGVIALSGFIEVAGRVLVFSILSNGIRNKLRVRGAHERIVVAAIDYLAHSSALGKGATPALTGAPADYQEFDVVDGEAAAAIEAGDEEWEGEEGDTASETQADDGSAY